MPLIWLLNQSKSCLVRAFFDSWQYFPDELIPSGSSSYRTPSSPEEAKMFRRLQPHGSAGWDVPPGVDDAPTAARAVRLQELAQALLLNPIASPWESAVPPQEGAPAWAADQSRFAPAAFATTVIRVSIRCC